MIGKLRKLRLRRRAEMSLEDIAKWLNPMISGGLNYYARYPNQ
ncbi:group II intron maturase-specific domain-containing protein [Escherichia albertii]